MGKLNRTEVYEIINDERDYQDQKWGGKSHDEKHSVSDWLIFIRKHLNDAENALYSSNACDAMNAIKKATALGIAAMENKGCSKND